MTGLVDGINYTQTNMGLTGLQNMYQQQPQQQQHQQQQHQNQQQHCPTSTPSPTLQQPGYRSPLARPSPQSSPGVSGRHSAPSSPAAPSPIPDYLQHFDVQATMLQQTFKEFSMMDSPNVTGGMNYMDQTSTVQTLPDVTSLVNCTSDMNTDPNIYYTTSPSSVGYPTVPTSLHTTPNTPTSIPDIIFTDFSNAPDDLNRQDSLDEDLFPSDESLREGLGSLDPLSIQMLSHPELNVISDSAEDYFRLDRL